MKGAPPPPIFPQESKKKFFKYYRKQKEIFKMSYFVKPIDLSKVAQLNNYDYVILWEIVNNIHKYPLEKDVPKELLHSYAASFYIMRKCGSTDLRCHDGIRWISSQISKSQLLIERLRSYHTVYEQVIF